jgi:hypothetical protein
MTACFLTPLGTEKIGPQRWLLTDELVYYSRRFGGLFVAPRGLQTDLASIPRVAWVIFPKVDRYDAAAVMHDAAYANALLTRGGDRVFVIQRVADALFHEGCVALGTPTWQAWLMYWAVRRFGNPAAHPLAAHGR